MTGMRPLSRKIMSHHRDAGRPVPAHLLADIPRLVSTYYTTPSADCGPVAFGTSGHRGSSLAGTFNEPHIVAIVAAVCDWREKEGIGGPLYLGADTHALSEPALATALEVLAARKVHVVVQTGGLPVPTPVISRAILRHNARADGGARADGLIITPSHNPPVDGGIKYNPPSGGPAGADVTSVMEARANDLLKRTGAVKRVSLRAARQMAREEDLRAAYVAELGRVIDMDAIRSADLHLGVDPMGGAAVGYWDLIADTYGIRVDVVQDRVDPTFSFMRLDHDGAIRMDCSSPWAMAGLVELADRFDLAFGNDPDVDRHGIVTPSVGLMNPNHYLAVAIDYLFTHRSLWPDAASVGKTLVSSSMIDRVAGRLGRRVVEVPVGFKWFVDGLADGSLGFGGEESAGASFLSMDASAWSTDKDGIIMNLLAAEILAVTGKDPGEHYARLTELFGAPVYARTDAAATPAQKAALKALSADDVQGTTLAGDPVIRILTRAPGNDAPIGGLKVESEHGWFAARPSGTEDIYKIYAESFRSEEHLAAIQRDAVALVASVLPDA